MLTYFDTRFLLKSPFTVIKLNGRSNKYEIFHRSLQNVINKELQFTSIRNNNKFYTYKCNNNFHTNLT